MTNIDPKRRFIQPKRFVKDPYAWECVKVLIAALDPRDIPALDRHFYKAADFPEAYKDFDQFMAMVIDGSKMAPGYDPFGGCLQPYSLDLLRRWRGASYPVPIDQETLTVLAFLPFHIGLRAVLAKDALIKEGYLGYEMPVHRGGKAPWKER